MANDHIADDRKKVRLIDADAFIEDIKTEILNLYLDGMKGTPRPRSELYDIIDRIGEQPTVDAVEVCRCKDCKHYKPRNQSARWDCKTPCCMRSTALKFPEDGFCSYGERRTNA
jgi:hypothetical protein